MESVLNPAEDDYGIRLQCGACRPEMVFEDWFDIEPEILRELPIKAHTRVGRNVPFVLVFRAAEDHRATIVAFGCDRIRLQEAIADAANGLDPDGSASQFVFEFNRKFEIGNLLYQVKIL